MTLLYHIILYLSIEKHKKTLILSIFFSFFRPWKSHQKPKQRRPNSRRTRTPEQLRTGRPASSPPFPRTRTRARMRPRPHICTHAHAPARFYFSSLFFRLCSLLLLPGLPSSPLLPSSVFCFLLPSPVLFFFCPVSYFFINLLKAAELRVNICSSVHMSFLAPFLQFRKPCRRWCRRAFILSHYKQ